MRSRRSRRTAAPNHKLRLRRHKRIRAAAARHRHHEAETLHRSNERLGNHSSNRRHMANTSNESGSCYTKPSRLPARRSNGPKPSGHRSDFIAVRYGTPAATRTERSNIMSWRKQSASPASVAVRAAKHIPAFRYSRNRGRRSALPYRFRSHSAYHATAAAIQPQRNAPLSRSSCNRSRSACLLHGRTPR